jgi:hydroxymethylpyrimidine kinase/phosphomethylpyrimidine kinase
VALTIAGSDSGGGAGLQADLKTFAALGVHGATAVTCVTAQNPRRVFAVQACRPAMVRKQIEAVFGQLRPAAVKTGMLYSAPIIREVAGFFRSREAPPLVVDPVMIATSGSRLLQRTALGALQRDLLPLADLVTPNLPEAEALAGRRLRSLEDLRAAAREIHRRFGCAALVKGGHLPAGRQAADLLFDGRNEWLFIAPFLAGRRLHGTGCTYSAAVTAHLALGRTLAQAVARAKTFVTRAIARGQLSAWP